MASSLYITNSTGSIFDLQTDITGSFTVHIPPGNTGIWEWVVERYGTIRQTGSFDVASTLFSPTLNFTTDIYVTQTTRATVEAYTEFSTLDELYDYAAYRRTQAPQHLLITKDGGLLDFGDTTIIVDASASSIWSYDEGTNTLTLKATELDRGSIFDAIRTSSTITTINGATITAVYISTDGVSQIVELRSIPAGASLAIYDAAGIVKQFWSNVAGGTYTYYIEPGVEETWYWAMERYGKVRNESSFPTNVGGIIYFVPDDVTDVGITETTAATVAAYTKINTIDQLYDAAALFRTTEAGIVIGNLITKSSRTLVLGALDLIANKTASTVFTTTKTTMTVKTDVLSVGSTYNQLSTTGDITTTNGASLLLSAIDATSTRSLLTISGLSSGVNVKVMDGATVITSGISTGTSITLPYTLGTGVLTLNATIYAEKATGNANGFALFSGSVILGQSLTNALITMTPDTFYGRSAGQADRANVTVTWDDATGAPTIALTNDTNIKSIYDIVVESHATVEHLTYNRPSTNDGNVYQFANANFTGIGKITGTTQFYTTGTVDVKYELILNSYNTVNFPTNSIVKIVKSDNTVLTPFGLNEDGKVELNMDPNTDYRVYIKSPGMAPKAVYINSGTGRVITITPVAQNSYSATTNITDLIPLVRLDVDGTMLNVYLSGMSVIPLKVVALVDYIQQQEEYADVALATENGAILYINDTNQITPVKANINFLRETTLTASQAVMWQTYFSTGSLSYPDANFTPEDSNQLFVNSFSSAIGQVVLMDSQVATIATTAVNQLLETVLSNGKTVRTNINEIDILTNIISTEVQRP
jgi:hypothetical protein